MLLRIRTPNLISNILQQYLRTAPLKREQQTAKNQLKQYNPQRPNIKLIINLPLMLTNKQNT